ncbi:preprotein translocase subunit SecG [Bordetella genomosp. 7]|uniref:Protein-export membrane protein SecG n=1 Tax=Bordetella genomosp. 7 TaxID=1416805 RepID=A0A261RJ37_9BORD|nr:preprotein translocase subunit SecG [Bordetella genomosp. 7]OZI24692.1 preprotein translocase subunit SecG [Bordetella genomosp. 7]
MSMTLTLLLVVQVLSALAIIVLVLLQQGKGADMGSAFGSGSAGSLFGATGAANFLSRTTKWAAVVFFASTLGLAYLSHKGSQSSGAMESGVMQDFPADRSVPQAPGAGGGSSVPQTPPAQPDASVPQTPAPAAQPQSQPQPESQPQPQSETQPAEVPAAPAQPDTPKPAQ